MSPGTDPAPETKCWWAEKKEDDRDRERYKQEGEKENIVSQDRRQCQPNNNEKL